MRLVASQGRYVGDTMTDAEYAREMIEHHAEAVRMSRELLKGKPDQKLKEFAQGVIKAQTKEIEWLQANYGDKEMKAKKPSKPQPAMPMTDKDRRAAIRANFDRRVEAEKRSRAAR